tara:strand:+ start:1091 stop:1753 length:663 start_codon:yes stop_codon:yes gene_type:complete
MKKATSYQRRSGRLSHNQKEQLISNPHLLRSHDALVDVLNSYSNKALALEIGFGMGEHLLQNALENSDIIHIGIDIYRPGIARVLQIIDEKKLNNCYVLEGDAVDHLASFGTIRFQSIDIHHPDPWPKKRHKKRQLLHQDFITTACKLLEENGKLQIITDDFSYFEHILEQISMPSIASLVESSITRNRPPNSKYGRKAVAEGREINAIDLIRRVESVVT